MDTRTLHEAMPLAATLGAVLLAASAERVALRVEWRAELCTADGILHGGALMALADAAGGLCAYLNLPPDATGTATIESKTNFLRAVRSGAVTATATPLHVGRRTIVVDTELRDDENRLVTRTTQTQAALS